MNITTFIICVYCIVDDYLRDIKQRQRGPKHTLSDVEVLTMEIVGEFLGIDSDSGLFHYFRGHYGDWFPALKQIHHTPFVRQAVYLSYV